MQTIFTFSFPLALVFASFCITGCNKQNTTEHAATKVVKSDDPNEPRVARDTETANSPDAKPPVDQNQLLLNIARAYQDNEFKLAGELIEKLDRETPVSINMLYLIGEVQFAIGKPAEAVATYDRMLDIRPELKPQLWQRGLALYYAGDFQGGIEQLESHQNYNSQDVENSVWHLAMNAKLSSVEEARKEMIPISRDGRVPMKQIFDMFAGDGSPEKVLAACDYDPNNTRPNSAIYHGWLYIGLFHEMVGDEKAANEAMKQAVSLNPLQEGLMAHIAKTHLLLRK